MAFVILIFCLLMSDLLHGRPSNACVDGNAIGCVCSIISGHQHIAFILGKEGEPVRAHGSLLCLNGIASEFTSSSCCMKVVILVHVLFVICTYALLG